MDSFIYSANIYGAPKKIRQCANTVGDCKEHGRSELDSESPCQLVPTCFPTSAFSRATQGLQRPLAAISDLCHLSCHSCRRPPPAWESLTSSPKFHCVETSWATFTVRVLPVAPQTQIVVLPTSCLK